MCDVDPVRFTSKITLQVFIDGLDNPVFVKDRQHKFVVVNQALADLVNVPKDELLAKSDFDLHSVEQANVFWLKDDEVFATGIPSESEEFFTDGSGRVRTISTTKRLLRVGGEDGDAYILGVISDITIIRASEARVRHLAYNDPLTDLGNRAYLNQRMEQAFALARRLRQRVAVLCVDLDRFKAVNDLLGHAAGDQLLREAARRLRGAVREIDSVARLGGDEFATIQQGVDEGGGAERLAVRIVDSLAESFDVGTGDVAIVSGSVGIAIFPEDGADVDLLLARADAALYRVKEAGRNGYAFFQPEMDGDVRARRALERDVRLALGRGELSLVYQPQADAVTGQVAGFEVLLRWTSPERGIVSPIEFIPVAEACGAIIPIGNWVVEAACAEAARWPAPLRIAVNVSPAQIQHGDFANVVSSTLTRTKLDPTRLEIEVTESLLIRDPAHALRTLRRLKALGVSVALDDFGTGYSSLSTLRSFAFDRVKIDRSFVRDLPNCAAATAVVRAVIGLGRGLGLPVVAEGVETAAQLVALQAEGCGEVQGYLIERPEPIEVHHALTHPTGARPVSADDRDIGFAARSLTSGEHGQPKEGPSWHPDTPLAGATL